MNEERPVRIELDPGQRETAASGFVDLTPKQARVAGATIRSRSGTGAGRPVSKAPRCACGCGLTMKRALMRHPERAIKEVKSK